ncbi:MAG: hypothetical protein PWQ40_1522, partial [Archaeoglobus sp.]|nr:hypothetical protein [Archaeoglobus sp.]
MEGFVKKVEELELEPEEEELYKYIKDAIANVVSQIIFTLSLQSHHLLTNHITLSGGSLYQNA